MRSEMSAADVASWATDQLDAQTWSEEVAHQGLQHLLDIGRAGTIPGTEAGAGFVETYRAWAREVDRYEADPVTWNRDYGRRLLDSFGARFGSGRTRVLGESMVAEGLVTSADLDDW